MSPLVVHFVPRWPQNPYHAELARHLAESGVAVPAECRLDAIVRTLRTSGQRPHLIHLHALPPFRFKPTLFRRFVMFWLRLLRLRLAGVKIVWTVHNITAHESPHPAIDRFVARCWYRCAAASIVHSAGARAAIEAQWKVSRRPNVFIVPHGHFIDCYPADATRSASRARLEVPEHDLVFLFVGQIRAYKGVVRLVREFRQLGAAGTRLIIAGETNSEPLRAEIAREIDSDPAIHFHPRFVPDDELQYYLGATDLVVFPYGRALTSGALILAMSFGRACIAPRIGALGDTLDEHGGFLYDPASPAALGEALAEAVRRRAALAEMGQYNRRRVEQWTWAGAGRATADIYRQCLRPAARAGSPIWPAPRPKAAPPRGLLS